MKINYKFEGNKIIKTIESEFTEKEMDLLKRVKHEHRVYITDCYRTDEEAELDTLIDNLRKCDLVKDQFGINEYTLTEIGFEFLKSYNPNK